MGNHKIPLPELIERGRDIQNGFGWDEFRRMAELPPHERPSRVSMGHIFRRNKRTIERWLRRYDEEAPHGA